MVKIVGFYETIGDIGNHESHIIKVGDFSSMNDIYRVTHVSGTNATVETKEGTQTLRAGVLLGKNALVRTNGDCVEITNSSDAKFRLKNRSEFCLELTVGGILPVVYGSVAYLPGIATVPLSEATHKYRTSCYTGSYPQIIEMVSRTVDAYYALEKGYDIIEYDEYGQKFIIAHVNPFEECYLEVDLSKSMRERYQVQVQKQMTPEKIQTLYAEYIHPQNWNYLATQLQEYSS